MGSTRYVHDLVGRRLSKLEMGEVASTSTRHLSYVETGRATPSRGMVLRLARALEVSLRETNQMLLGAGLAPAYPDARIDHVARAALLDLLDGVLEGHLPNPALVPDAEFDVVATNVPVDPHARRAGRARPARRSFLDFNQDYSSMIMAGLFAVALSSYVVGAATPSLRGTTTATPDKRRPTRR